MTRPPVPSYGRAERKTLRPSDGPLARIVAEHSALAAYERASGEVVVKRISVIDPKGTGGGEV